MLDVLTEFVHYLPQWTKRGKPLSWRHFIYGQAWIRRHVARESIRTAGAVGAAMSSKKNYKDWRKEMNRAADY